MITTWFAYCAAVALLLGVAAAALERLLRLYGRPARWAWAAALACTVLLPLLPRGAGQTIALLEPAAAGNPTEAPPGPAATVAPALARGIVIAAPSSAAPAVSSWSALAEAHLPRLWLVSSLALACALGIGTMRMLRRRRRWPGAVVAGVPVLVSEETGPAVAGFFRPSIVMPEWALSWDEARQHMMVEHEMEHVRARDPLLILGSWVAAILFPWNPAVWWQARRLRLALEMDCDARVLRARPGVSAYGALLLDVGRLSSTRWAVAAFSEPVSLLERRIRRMTARPPRHRARIAAVLLLAAGATAAGAGGLPGPTLRLWADEAPPLAIMVEAAAAAERPSPPTAAGGAGTAAARPEPSAPPAPALADTLKPRLLNSAAVARGLEAAYPELLRSAGVGGTVVMEVATDERGHVRELRALRASHPEFARAAEQALRAARFAPARVGERAVPFRFRVPVSFVPLAAPADVPALSNLAAGPAARADAVRLEALRASEEAVQLRETQLQRDEERLRRASEFRRWEEAAAEGLREHQPAIALAGTGEHTYVWLMADATGRVVGSGTQPLRWQASPAMGAATKVWHVDTVRDQLSVLHPSVRIQNVSILMTHRDGQPLHVAWVRLQPGSATP